MPLTENVHQDVFQPRLAPGTPALFTTEEQRFYIREVLELCCSDSRQAERALAALIFILGAGQAAPLPPPLPVLTSLVPNTVAIGAPDFNLQILGTGFVPTSEVLINGNPATPSTFVSPTELGLFVDMSLVLAPVVVQISVRNGLDVSNQMPFTVTL